MRDDETFWVLHEEEADAWHDDAEEVDARDAKEAAEEFVMNCGALEDDGDEVRVIVAKERDGGDARVYVVTCEVVREYSAEAKARVKIPSPPPDENAEAPPPIDTRTLPLFDDGMLG